MLRLNAPLELNLSREGNKVQLGTIRSHTKSRYSQQGERLDALTSDHPDTTLSAYVWDKLVSSYNQRYCIRFILTFPPYFWKISPFLFKYRMFKNAISVVQISMADRNRCVLKLWWPEIENFQGLDRAWLRGVYKGNGRGKWALEYSRRGVLLLRIGQYFSAHWNRTSLLIFFEIISDCLSSLSLTWNEYSILDSAH